MTRKDATLVGIGEERIGHLQTFHTTGGPVLKLARYRRKPTVSELVWEGAKFAALSVWVFVMIVAFLVTLFIGWPVLTGGG